MKPRNLLIPLLLGIFVGCYSPQRTVRLVLKGVDDDMTWESLRTVLPTLVDGEKNYAMSWSGSRPGSISLAPVAQPEAFALRIKFGKSNALKAEQSMSALIRSRPEFRRS